MCFGFGVGVESFEHVVEVVVLVAFMGFHCVVGVLGGEFVVVGVCFVVHFVDQFVLFVVVLVGVYFLVILLVVYVLRVVVFVEFVMLFGGFVCELDGVVYFFRFGSVDLG